MLPHGLPRFLILSCGVALCACAPSRRLPEWVSGFAYEEGALHTFEIRAFGFPFVQVGIGVDTTWLPFDTGNMAGLTLATDLFDRFSLPCSDEWDRKDSSGKVVSTGCTATGIRISVFGVTHDSLEVLEFFDEAVPGLVGPDLLPETRVTLDYAAGLLATDRLATTTTPPGFTSVPLIRSSRHPLLILVMGRVEGRDVLLELDTGKSRTTVDRRLVEELGLVETKDGVRIGRVQLGPLEWSVSSARVVNTSGISAGLPEPISLGVGSDVLSGFTFTVDYAAGMLWVEHGG